MRVGGAAPPRSEPAPAPTQPGVAAPGAAASVSADAALAEAKRVLAGRQDVVDVRLGWAFQRGWITNERAIMVTVRRKLPAAALRDANVTALPERIGGLPVDVTSASPEELIAADRGPAVARELFVPPDVVREEITYQPPAGGDLGPVSAQMKVVAHVSPDAGWPTLRDFLLATRKRLVVGMYDFGARHILASCKQAGSGNAFEEFTLAMQHGQSLGTGTKENDCTDDEAVDELRTALADKFENAWVRIGPVNGWVSSSYHIKVAVRDSSAFWLSSGNWQSSNQPDADPSPVAQQPWDREWLDTYNREWHVVVEHEGLAKTFERYLRNDFDANREYVPPAKEELAVADVLVPEALLLPTAEERARRFEYFEPLKFEGKVQVQPLLTPDNYFAEVLKLVESAEQELLIQNQTFDAPKVDGPLKQLLDAVRRKQDAGVKVRVIFRVLFASKAKANLAALKDFGIDVEGSVKVQRNCHTKGVIVDGKRVLVGSQNWSKDGVSLNRDASLLFESADIAGYFRKIFLHDWENLAVRSIGNEALAPEWAPAGGSTPAGMVRMSWKEYREGL